VEMCVPTVGDSKHNMGTMWEIVTAMTLN